MLPAIAAVVGVRRVAARQPYIFHWNITDCTGRVVQAVENLKGASYELIASIQETCIYLLNNATVS